MAEQPLIDQRPDELGHSFLNEGVPADYDRRMYLPKVDFGVFVQPLPGVNGEQSRTSSVIDGQPQVPSIPERNAA